MASHEILAGDGQLDLNNPIDLYRREISKGLAPVTGKPENEVYNRLAWTQTFDKGDLGLAAPSLRIPGKPAELAKSWSEQYPESELVGKPTVSGQFLQFFFKPEPLTKLIIPSILKKSQHMAGMLSLDYGMRLIHLKARSGSLLNFHHQI